MSSEKTEADTAPESERLRELAYLCSAVGHHVINGFSSAVSNAEQIRSSMGARLSGAELTLMGNRIVEKSLDASQVARRLIDWARRETAIEHSNRGREPESVDLNQLIGEVIASQKCAGNDPIDWVVNLNSIPPIRGDSVHLRAMMGYLVQNAREALPQGAGRIVFSTLIDTRGWLVFSIHDSGRGMSPEVRERAIEPFFSTKPDRDGIGLTIANGIWRRHHGMFSIESSPGQGTTVRLTMIQQSAPKRPTE